jgi:hypothetical protein
MMPKKKKRRKKKKKLCHIIYTTEAKHIHSQEVSSGHGISKRDGMHMQLHLTKHEDNPILFSWPSSSDNGPSSIIAYRLGYVQYSKYLETKLNRSFR